MKRLAMVGVALIFASGCGSSGSGSAASTDPNKPSAIRVLKVKGPSETSIKQNGTVDLDISVTREHFTSPVVLDFPDLPAGVTVATPSLTIESGKDSLKVTLKAALDAKVENGQTVHVVAKAKDQSDMKDVSEAFKLNVKVKD